MNRTYGDYRREIEARLRAAGRENAGRESLWLLEAFVGEKFWQFHEEEALAPVLAKTEAALDRLSRGEPFQYVLGSQDFFGLSFIADRRGLIPRPETEILLEKALSLSLPDGPILDLCCGSGCIAVTLGHRLPERQVWATDLSAGALSLAKENAALHGVEIRFCEGDLFTALPADAPPFALVISNPPYVPRDEIPALGIEIGYEPREALDGGADGLDFYRRILPEAHSRLLPNGCLLLEAGADQGAALLALAAGLPYEGRAIFPDLAGRERFFFARRQA